MTQKIKHYCRCGDRAVVENTAIGDWYCPACAIEVMLEETIRGEPVSISLGDIRITDVLIAPRDSGGPDLFAPLAGVVPISFCRN